MWFVWFMQAWFLSHFPKFYTVDPNPDYIENLPVPHTQTNENSEDNENKEMLKNEIEAKRTEFENNLPSNLILY